MATTTKNMSCEISPKSQVLSLFLVLMLVVPLVARPLDTPITTTTIAAAASTTGSVVDREFRVAEHDVPTGPNPEANK